VCVAEQQVLGIGGEGETGKIGFEFGEIEFMIEKFSHFD